MVKAGEGLWRSTANMWHVVERASARGDRLMSDGTYHLPIAGAPKHSVNISIGVRDYCVLSDKSKNIQSTHTVCREM